MNTTRMVPSRRLLPALPPTAWLVLSGDALSAVGSGLTLPFFLVYLSRIRGFEVGLAGLALATVALTGFAGNPLGGWLSDRIGSRRTLIGGLIVAAAGAFGVTLVQVPWHAFAAAAVVGLGTAVIWPAQDSLLATVVAPRQRSSVFAVRHATLNSGFGAGALISALIVDLASPTSFVVLYVVDGLTFLAFVPILLALRHIGNVDRAAGPANADAIGIEPRNYLSVLRDRTFLRVWLLTALLITVGVAQLRAGFPAFTTGTGEISASGLSIAFAANTLVVVAAQLFVLRWMAGRRRTAGIALASACWGLTWVVTLLGGKLGGGMTAVVVFAMAMVIFAVGETLLSPSLAPLVNDLATDELRGRYNGLYTLAWTTGFAAGPVIAGAALGAGDGEALLVGLTIACALATLAAWRLGQHLTPVVNAVGPGEIPLGLPPAKESP